MRISVREPDRRRTLLLAGLRPITAVSVTLCSPRLFVRKSSIQPA